MTFWPWLVKHQMGSGPSQKKSVFLPFGESTLALPKYPIHRVILVLVSLAPFPNLAMNEMRPLLASPPTGPVGCSLGLSMGPIHPL
jgi:hypothetical protein